MKFGVVINPQSGGGRTIKVWRSLGEKLNRRVGHLELAFSEKSGHLTELAREMAQQDIDRLIVVGGDGSLHEVVNGLFLKGKPLFKPTFELAIFNGGRGCDYAKSIALPDDPERMLDLAVNGKSRLVDIGSVKLNNEKEVLYINSSTIGLGGEIASSLQTGSSILPPSASYLTATVKSVFSAIPKFLKVVFDGKPTFEGLAQNLFVCNGRYSGGGMLWAPEASISDGLFDAIIVRDLSRIELLTLAPRLYSGTITKVSGITAHQAETVDVSSNEILSIELDGEVYKACNIHYSMLKQVIRLVQP